MPCFECQAWNSDYESCTIPGSQLEYVCPDYVRNEARRYIENEARANNLWHIFQDLKEEEWNFITDLLVRYNERKAYD